MIDQSLAVTGHGEAEATDGSKEQAKIAIGEYTPSKLPLAFYLLPHWHPNECKAAAKFTAPGTTNCGS